MAKCWKKNGRSSILNNWFVFDIIKRYQYQDGITSQQSDNETTFDNLIGVNQAKTR